MTTQISDTQLEVPVPQYIAGELTRLRPILTADLGTVARLMSEAPRGFNELDMAPVSEYTLRKKFDDDKQPGLWSDLVHFMAITDCEDRIVGILREGLTTGGRVSLQFHLETDLAGRSALGLDALKAYVGFRCAHGNVYRFEVLLLEVLTEEIGWLESLGFKREVTVPEGWFYQGRPATLCIYGWVADWIMAQRAPQGSAAVQE